MLFGQREQAQAYAPQLAQAMSECKSALRTVAVFSLAINILILATPLYMLQVMDRVLRSASLETLALLTLMALGAVLVMSLLDTLRAAVAMRTGAWINESLGPVFIESSVRANLAGDDKGTEPLRDIGEIQNLVATQGMAAFFDAPWVPIFVVFIWLLHPYLGGIALVSAVLLFVLSIANERATRQATLGAHQAYRQAMGLADITIRNAEVVRAMGMMPAMLSRWRAANADVTAAYQLAGETSGRILLATKFVRAAVQIGVLGGGAWLVVDNQITTGSMIAAAILLGRALAPVEMAIGGWKSFVSARLALERLNRHLEAYPAEPRMTALPAPAGRLEVEQLSYAIGGSGAVVLHDVSFVVEPGEVLAVVGPSGAGKSTLCRLLVGLAQPYSGAVRLDGSDLKHWPADDLGRYIGYLPQDVELFPGTVAENIARMGEPRDGEVVAAAVSAHAHPMIQRLPGGYATPIGSGGVRLSGGQRQRVGLARAVFGSPRLIVLDEPNANLDQAGECALTDAIKDLKATGSALVIVGHRPSTLAQADKIVVLSEGTVILYGQRDDVLEAWSETSAMAGGADAVPLRRTGSQPNALTRSSELEASAS